MNDTRCNSPHDEPVAVAFDSPEFAQFEHWIDGELTGLVSNWAHWAAPNAQHFAERKYMQSTRGGAPPKPQQPK